MAGFQGKKNAYTCGGCGFQFVTVDTDDGTTPFLTSCQRQNDKGDRCCGGTAQSSMYRIDQSLPATHEWYRMTDGEAAKHNAAVRQHHTMGGLMLRLRMQ